MPAHLCDRDTVIYNAKSTSGDGDNLKAASAKGLYACDTPTLAHCLSSDAAMEEASFSQRQGRKAVVL
jgi:hypothetical protein